jgi:nuclear pore complex protein Nup205
MVQVTKWADITFLEAHVGLCSFNIFGRIMALCFFQIGDLYRKDPLDLDLALEYWCPPDPVSLNDSYRPSSRSVNLYKFVRLAGDLLPAPLFVHYLRMLTGLSSSPQGAHSAFHLLKTNGLGSGNRFSTIG